MLGYARSQNGFTLIEVIIATAIGAILMGGLTSVVLTSTRAGTIATSRVDASAQIRNFQLFAHDDFARTGAPSAGACTPAAPCTTPITLTGTYVSSLATPAPGYKVTYAWDGSNFLDRQVAGAGSIHAATNVTKFSWYIDTNGAYVVTLTVTVRAYSQSQTFLFYPQVHP